MRRDRATERETTVQRSRPSSGNRWLTLKTLTLLAALLGSACSIEKLALNKVADTLSSEQGGSVFTSDNDPELVGEALPFAIKMYESLLMSLPGHRGLRLRTGSLYVMYANAFIQTPATMLSDEQYRRQEFLYRRAKNLYLRGRDITMEALETRVPGFKRMLDAKRYDEALEPCREEDVPFLYWAAAGWLGAFAIEPFDMDLMVTMPGAAAMMERVLELDEGYGDGAVHDFFVLYYGSMPAYMGGDFDRARDHFAEAIDHSEGKLASPYLSLATTVSIQDQNLEEFIRLLTRALEIDPDERPESRLANILSQRKARWYLEHRDDFFLVAEEANPEY